MAAPQFDSYLEARQWLEANFPPEDVPYSSNRFEQYLIEEQGLLPTAGELSQDEQAAYDMFMTLYYNQPHLAKAIPADLLVDVAVATVEHAGSSGDEGMIEMIALTLAQNR